MITGALKEILDHTPRKDIEEYLDARKGLEAHHLDL